MKIDSSRFKLFNTNPEQYRLQEIWRLTPIETHDLLSTGRRRGTAFHEMHDGVQSEDLAHLGANPVATAEAMFLANQDFDKRMGTEVVWKEKEFDIAVPDSPHRMVGRIDSRVNRGESNDFILDFKTSKSRTKAEMQVYRDHLYQSPQVDFYLSAETDIRRMTYRILWKKPKITKGETSYTIEISELDVYREPYQLKAFQRAVHMTCETIEFWKREFGIEKPWPRAVALPVPPELYDFAPIYLRNMYEGAEREGFTETQEHLACLKESQ